MGVCKSKQSTQVTEPKTLLNSTDKVSGKSESGALDVLKKYLADASAASEADLKSALEGLPVSERKRLADALNCVDVPATGDGAPADVDKSAKGLEHYLDDLKVASNSDVLAALQGLPPAFQQRLADALGSLPVVDVPPTVILEATTSQVEEDVDAPPKMDLGAPLAQGESQETDVSLVASSTPALADAEPEPSNGKGWFTCCNSPTDSGIEFRVATGSAIESAPEDA